MLMILFQLDPDLIDKVVPHWALDFGVAFTGACFVATLIARIMPPPSMFPVEKLRPYYAFMFFIVDSLNLSRKNWSKKGNGKSDPNHAEQASSLDPRLP